MNLATQVSDYLVQLTHLAFEMLRTARTCMLGATGRLHLALKSLGLLVVSSRLVSKAGCLEVLGCVAKMVKPRVGFDPRAVSLECRSLMLHFPIHLVDAALDLLRLFMATGSPRIRKPAMHAFEVFVHRPNAIMLLRHPITIAMLPISTRGVPALRGHIPISISSARRSTLRVFAIPCSTSLWMITRPIFPIATCLGCLAITIAPLGACVRLVAIIRFRALPSRRGATLLVSCRRG